MPATTRNMFPSEIPRHERLRRRIYAMRVEQKEIAQRIFESGEMGFSSTNSLRVYISRLLSGVQTSKPTLDRIENILDDIEEERRQRQAA